MEIKTFTVRTSHGRFRGGGGSARSNNICYFWKEGKCNRNPCRFVHGDSPAPNDYHRSLKQSQSQVKDRLKSQSQVKDRLRKTLKYVLGENVKNHNVGYKGLPRKCSSYSLKNLSVLKTESGVFEDNGGEKRSNHDTDDVPRKCCNPKNLLAGLEPEDKCIEENSGYETKVLDVKKITVQQKFPEYSPKDAAVDLTTEDPVPEVKIAQNNQQKACEQWMSGSCMEGEGCPFLHSWSLGDGFLMLAKLSRHSEAVSGIALPSGSDKLYSGSTDGTVHVWDCHTGQSVGQMNLGDKIGSLISEGPWVFVGVPNVVKAWNIQTAAEFSLNGPVGQVHAMVVACNMLFAGAQNGVILVWKGSNENPNPFQLAASLEGHMSAVTCLAVGAKGLCSGSMDGTIKVWDLDSLQCIQTLNGHTDAVMSLISWNHQYLLSCSLDRTIKVWFAADGSNFEVTYTHEEEHGALALCGVNDAETRPVLLCSCNDSSVRLYELPSFMERGRIFSKQEVRTMQIGPDGLFFTGDGTGVLNVWKWAEQRAAL